MEIPSKYFKNKFFYHSYAGNKRNELKYIFKTMDDVKKFENVEYIIEPFCGTCVFSRFLFQFYPNKKYVCNDINERHINFLNYVKLNSSKDILLKFNELKRIYGTKEEYMKIDFSTNDIHLYYFINAFKNIRIGMFPTNRKPADKEYTIQFQELDAFFMSRNVKLVQGNFTDILHQYGTLNSVFYLDPPYMSLCNDWYKLNNGDITETISFALKMLDTAECKIIYSINKNSLTEYIFKKYIVLTYHFNFSSRSFKRKTKCKSSRIDNCDVLLISNL